MLRMPQWAEIRHYHRWRNQYGGMKGPEMKRLKERVQQHADERRNELHSDHDVEMLGDERARAEGHGHGREPIVLKRSPLARP